MSFVKRLSSLTGAVFASAAIVLPAASLPVYAAQAAQNNPGGSGLQISPTRSETTINPGETKSVKVTLKNVTAGPVIAKPSINDFESDNETGQPKIIVDTKKRSDYSAAPFIETLKDVELAVNETKEVSVIINMPKGAAPGGYFSAIRYAAVPKSPTDSGSQNTQVALTASLAHLILIQVNGNITQGLKFDAFDLLSKGKAGSFFLSPPTEAAVALSNTGNGFAQPFGKVTITKGSKTVYSYEINDKDPRGNILPKSKRTFKDPVKKIGSFGKFTAVASVTYQQGGEVVTSTKSFWVVPAWAVGALVLLVLAVIGGILYLLAKQKSLGRKR